MKVGGETTCADLLFSRYSLYSSVQVNDAKRLCLTGIGHAEVLVVNSICLGRLFKLSATFRGSLSVNFDSVPSRCTCQDNGPLVTWIRGNIRRRRGLSAARTFALDQRAPQIDLELMLTRTEYQQLF